MDLATDPQDAANLFAIIWQVRAGKDFANGFDRGLVLSAEQSQFRGTRVDNRKLRTSVFSCQKSL